MANFKVGIGSNIKMIRKMAGVTQEELAEIVGIHSRQLSKIETGDHFPSCKTLEKICMAMEIEPKTLFDFDFYEEDCEFALTGTDGRYFKVENKDKSNNCTDESMSNLAKSLNKPVFAEYYNNKKSEKIVVFYPDGREKVIRSSEDSEEKQEIISLMNEIRKIVKDKRSLEFVKSAINSLNDNDSLIKLGILVDGMKLARRLD